MAKRSHTGETTTRPFAYLRGAAEFLVERAEQTEDGSFYSSLMANVASMFMLEAFFNHIGPSVLESWPELARFSPEEKLAPICQQLDIETDFGRSPWQSFRELVLIRNQVAHGRTVTKSGSWKSDDPPSCGDFGLKPTWEKFAEPKAARRLYEAACEIAETLWHASGRSHSPFGSLSSTSSTSPKPGAT